MKAPTAVFWGLAFFINLHGDAWAITPREIADRAQGMERTNSFKMGGVTCRLTEIREELDEHGVVEERAESQMVLAASSVPVPGHKESLRIFPEMQKANPTEESSVLDHTELFDWTLEAEDESQGEPCYRLVFTPKKDAKPKGARVAVIARTSGHCWVSKRDFSKIRLEGRLLQPVEVAGFLVKVLEVDFVSVNLRRFGEVAAPYEVSYRFRVEVFPCFDFHERHTQKFDFNAGASAGTQSPLSPRNQKGGVAGLN